VCCTFPASQPHPWKIGRPLPHPPLRRSLYCRGEILATHTPAARRAFVRLFAAAGVQLREGVAVAAVERGRLVLEGGGEAAFDECLWCTQVGMLPRLGTAHHELLLWWWLPLAWLACPAFRLAPHRPSADAKSPKASLPPQNPVTPQAAAAGWLASTGLPLDPEGFIRIADTLQCDGGPEGVFAAGDVASCPAHPRPKAGVFAVRQVGRRCRRARAEV
jgi:hypothetical protein